MAERSFPSSEQPDPAQQVVSRLQAHFEDLDEGLELPTDLPPSSGAIAPATTTRTTGHRGLDDLNLQLEVLREQLDLAFDEVDQRLDAAETRASVAEARASVAEARASVAEPRAHDAESRVSHAEQRISEIMALLSALAPDDEKPAKDAAGPTSLRGALDRLRDRLEA
jgi:hypothetical protein